MHFFTYAPDNQNFRENNFYYFIGTWNEWVFAYKKEGADFVIYFKKIVDAGDWKVYVNCSKFFTINYKHNCLRNLPVATCIDGNRILIVASDMIGDISAIKTYSIGIPDRQFKEYEIINAPGIHQIFFCSNCFQCYIVPDPNEPGAYSIITWSPQMIKPITNPHNHDNGEEVQSRFLYLRFKLEGDSCFFLKAGLPRILVNLNTMSSNIGLLNKDAIIYATNANEITISNFGDESWFSLENFKLELSADSDLKEWKQIAFIQGEIQAECIVKENPNNNEKDEINAYTFDIDIEKMKIKFTKKQSLYTSKKTALANFCTTRILSTPNALFMPYYSKIFTKVQRILSLSEICYLTISGCKSEGIHDIAHPQHQIKRLIRLPKNYALVKSNVKPNC